MGFWDIAGKIGKGALSIAIDIAKELPDAAMKQSGVIDYGKQKKDGSHDHRYDRGDDRTPSQKSGDKKSGKG